MCLRTDLWPHRKEVQALPIEREIERERERKSPWSFLVTDGARVLSRETCRCVRSGYTNKDEEGTDWLSSSYFIHRHESWKSLTHTKRADWLWQWMCWVLVTTCLPSCLLWQRASQASFQHISRFMSCFLRWANLSRQSGHCSFDPMHFSYLSDEDL